MIIYFLFVIGPTTVFFHVTVMGLDSIDETSMVIHILRLETKQRFILHSCEFILAIFFSFDFLFRHMQLIYFLHKRGKIIVYVYQKI